MNDKTFEVTMAICWLVLCAVIPVAVWFSVERFIESLVR